MFVALISLLLGGLMIKSANMVLQEIGLVDSLVTESMRKWLAIKVIIPLAKRIEAADLAFKEQGISELDCTNTTLVAAYQLQGAGAAVQSAKPRSLIELKQAYPSNPLV
jgi:hypothetical protein